MYSKKKEEMKQAKWKKKRREKEKKKSEKSKFCFLHMPELRKLVFLTGSEDLKVYGL